MSELPASLDRSQADPVASDSDSDLDINVQELDEASKFRRRSQDGRYQQTPARLAQRAGTRTQGAGSRIALRDLRTHHERPTRGGEDTRILSGDEDEEALHGLLVEGQEHEGSREPDVSGSRTGDSAPLLQDHIQDPLGLPGPLSKGDGAASERRGRRAFPWLRARSTKAGTAAAEDVDALEKAEDTIISRATQVIDVGWRQTAKHPPNSISNAKYNVWTFLPLTLYNEFSLFLNLYFLLVALSQIVPALRIGYLSTYVAPLVFVLSVTLGKEAVDDLARRRRDAEANAERYSVLCFADDTTGDGISTRKRHSSIHGATSTRNGPSKTQDHPSAIAERPDTRASRNPPISPLAWPVTKYARDLNVGDVLILRKGQRVPADVVILGSRIGDRPSSSESQTHQSPAASTDVPNLIQALADNSIPVVPAVEAQQQEIGVTQADGVAETFIRTEQLDGETDWKLRFASPLTQKLEPYHLPTVQILASQPERNINRFVGTVKVGPHSVPYADQQSGTVMGDTSIDGGAASSPTVRSAPLTIDNTAWANTILASNSVTYAAVIYTGPHTRQALSTSRSRSKMGRLEMELNALTKILCVLTLVLSMTLVAFERIEATGSRKWYIAIPRFIILFSTIIPISLRVNLDMGKSVYSRFIETDEGIKGAVVRTSTIPEDLGRIEYLLSDKTGTLTQNDMELKKIHVGTVSYANEAMDEVAAYVRQTYGHGASGSPNPVLSNPTHGTSPAALSATRTRRDIGARIRDVVLALALCHNVTPTTERKDGQSISTYQASSPDEIAIIRWVESVGLRLSHRDRKSIVLQSVDTDRVVVRVNILEVFPFSSETKRMGILAQFTEGSGTGKQNPVDDEREIWFFEKGADTVMASMVAANDWLEEETSNMAREGLRTLVIGRKRLSPERYAQFSSSYQEASLALHERDLRMAAVVKEYLEQNLELLGVTGVEDQLQKDVKPSIELLRNAGIRIWMLTGDKIETARCVAVSARLIHRGQYVHTISQLKRKDAVRDSLEFLRSKPDASLVVDGESLALLLSHDRESFIAIAILLPTVIACRCSPTQKAEVAQLIRARSKKRVCCIGDGGNDVSMIQAADVGVGIVGKEGHQASLAADFSVEQFCHLPKLLLWHGRNSYKRSAKLAQFVIHRGLIISVCQTMFSIASRFEPIALYKDWLLVGYATVYTMAPVFSLVLDRDVDEGLAKLYPELYKELTEGRSLSYRTFFVWLFVSIYQGCVIQGLSQLLVAGHGPRMVSVSFTVLVINELVMVAFEITTWHPVMILSLLTTALIYLISLPFLGRHFDLPFLLTLAFLWRVLAISSISLIPPYLLKIARRTWKPPSYRKVQNI